MLLPELFTRFADAVSISQARRAAGFVPFGSPSPAAAAVLARLLSIGALPIGLAAGIAFQLAYPGDFGYGLDQGGPALATWIAFAGGAAALAAGIVLPSPRTARPHGQDCRGDRRACGAPRRAARVHALGRAPVTGKELTPGLVRALQEQVPKRAVVFSDDATSYEIAALRRCTSRTRCPATSRTRRRTGRTSGATTPTQFFRTGDLAIPRRYGATWLVVDRSRSKLKLTLPRAYADARYVLYRLS